MTNKAKPLGEHESETHRSNEIQRLLRGQLSDLALELNESQITALAVHFSLLLKWNSKMNLTSLRRPEEIAARHFGESLFATKILRRPVESEARMIDVGSGAGFPGVPMKIAWPSMGVVLLEPNLKKAAFLKEVARSCGLDGVEVRTERLEAVARSHLRGTASLVTLRAVASPEDVMRDLRSLLRPGGQLALFLGEADAARVRETATFSWSSPVAVPHSERRVILVGTAQL